MTDPDCLFCKIVAGEIPSVEVTSSESTYAFRDVNPGAPTHVLVVPRRHIESVNQLLKDAIAKKSADVFMTDERQHRTGDAERHTAANVSCVL